MIDRPTSTDNQNRQILSVGQLNAASKRLLESNFSSVWIEGEISNLAKPSSGHWYFTLKDDQAQVRCAMFRNNNQRLRFQPEHGSKVLARAKVSLYEARGEYQLIVQHLEPAGAGAMQLAFEQLKEKLANEGLFDSERKRELPGIPQHIGVITSPTGAALHDILTVLKRRYPLTPITLFPAQVQGKEAPAQLCDAITLANRCRADLQPEMDVLLVGRGGGSLEDLWAFNDETLARTIASSALPIVSAVGHETDFTIADFVADLRAPTPSAAAELLSPDSDEIRQQFQALQQALIQTFNQQIQLKRQETTWLFKRLRHPGSLLQEYSQRLDELDLRLIRAQKLQLTTAQHKIRHMQARLAGQTPSHALTRHQLFTGALALRLKKAMFTTMQNLREQLSTQAQLLNTVSPLNTLNRGYAIVSDTEGKILTDQRQVIPGQKISARLAHGALDCTVDSVSSDT